ncbi:glutamate racemase [Candidatus Kaiserbacteria bacterium]|nr:glutamate racemase [Candidatus Kaiserbacteria bacterium]
MIGVFDSGFGGLHVLRGIVKHLPEYRYVYLGDSHRAPYGDRPQSEVLEFTSQGIDFLFKKGAEIVIVACNTASSEALQHIQSLKENKKVLGVLVPFAEAAVSISTSQRIGVIATRGTVQSNAFVREIVKLSPEASVVQQACPRLVPLVEAGEENSELARKLLEKYLHPLLIHEIDTLVLGCTHYGILESLIRDIVGQGIHIISERDVIPQKLKEYLHRHPEIKSRLQRDRVVEFYSTGNIQTFDALGTRFFGASVRAQHVVLT